VKNILPSFYTFIFGARKTVPSDSMFHELSQSSGLIQGNSIQLTSTADCKTEIDGCLKHIFKINHSK